MPRRGSKGRRAGRSAGAVARFVGPRSARARIFGLAGASEEDETELLTRLLPELHRRGLRVSVLRFIPRSFDIDRPGKDSFEHRRAGASEVLVLSAKRWAILHENLEESGVELDELVSHMSPVDLVIALGFGAHAHDRLEIHRAGSRTALRCFEDSRIVAIASDEPIPERALPPRKPPVIDLVNIGAIADFMLHRVKIDPS